MYAVQGCESGRTKWKSRLRWRRSNRRLTPSWVIPRSSSPNAVVIVGGMTRCVRSAAERLAVAPGRPDRQTRRADARCALGRLEGAARRTTLGLQCTGRHRTGHGPVRRRLAADGGARAHAARRRPPARRGGPGRLRGSAAPGTDLRLQRRVRRSRRRDVRRHRRSQVADPVARLSTDEPSRGGANRIRMPRRRSSSRRTWRSATRLGCCRPSCCRPRS